MAAAPDAADQASPASTQSAAADNAAPPFAELDSPALPDPTSAKPVVDALPTAATTVTQSPAPDGAAALEAVLPQTAVSEPAAKPPRSGEARDSDKSAARSSAVLADLRTAQLDPAVAPPPIGEITDAAARPAQRDSRLDVVTLPATTSPSATDTTAAPTTGAALAPAHSHSAASPATAPPTTLAGQSTPIDTRADHWHEALASRVQVLVDQHVGEAHIKLNPPELGSVDIKISLVDDKTFVQLTAGSSAARDELTQSLPKLRELLSAGGLSLGGASVHGGSAGAGGYATASHVGVPAYTPFAFAESDEPEAVRPMRGPAGRIDLFA
jgi:flagellar hook-length control protein FliK